MARPAHAFELRALTHPIRPPSAKPRRLHAMCLLNNGDCECEPNVDVVDDGGGSRPRGTMVDRR